MTPDEAGQMAIRVLREVTEPILSDHAFDPEAKAILADAWTRLHATLSSQLAPAELIEDEGACVRNLYGPLVPLVDILCRMSDQWYDVHAEQLRRLLSDAERELQRIAGLIADRAKTETGL